MTFSIIGRDTDTGEIGLGIASGFPATGGICLFARPDGGAAISQGYGNPALGAEAVRAMAAGHDHPDRLVDALLRPDPAPHLRQIHLMTLEGTTGGHDGSGLTRAAGSYREENLSVAGNLLSGFDVVHAMASAWVEFREEGRGITWRILSALEAGQRAGGDARGIQSAAIVVIGDVPFRLADLRIDHARRPLAALKRLVKTWETGHFAAFRASALGLAQADPPPETE